MNSNKTKSLNINKKGELFFIESKEKFRNLLIIFPFLFGVMTLLFIIGAKNTAHLVFSICWLLIVMIFYITILVIFYKKVKSTISTIGIDGDIILLETCRFILNRNKTKQIKRNELKLKDYHFSNYGKSTKTGWKIYINNKPQYNIIKEFFKEEEILEVIDQISRSDKV
jgi:hypothetical protein